MKKDTLGDRMKQNYENVSRVVLPNRMPVIVRLDGKSFHSFTRYMNRPFDDEFIENMSALTKHLCAKIPTTVFAYSQSDEISLLLHNYKRLTSEPWFGNGIQKLASISAGIASSFFSLAYSKEAIFDARAFVLPEAEVANYFLWRQIDATRNSILMSAQALYSHKEMHQKNTKVLQEMMFQKGQNWNDLPTYKKRGFAVYKLQDAEIPPWYLDFNIPKFSDDREFVEKWLRVEEE